MSEENEIPNGDISAEDSENPQQEKSQKKVAKYDSGAADLEKVTDYAEEKEIFSADLSGAMTIIGDRRHKEAEAKMARERELQKVSIKKEDVDLIAREMEISRNLAEQTLREHHGNVVSALVQLTD